MAEPISVIGLVSGIISLVDFGLKVVSETRRIKGSIAQGSCDEIEELENYIEDVRQWNASVTNQQSTGLELSQDEKRILRMVKECEELAKELRGMLKKLKVQSGAPSKRVEAVRVAFQRRLKYNDVKDLRSRLERLDDQIRRNVGSVMQMNSHSSVVAKLDQLGALQEHERIRDTSHLARLREDILRLVEQTRQDNATQAARLVSLKTKFDALQKEQASCSYQIEVLKSLHFEEIRRRWYQIKEANKRSNEWIYDSQATTFVPWLENEGSNDGFFYITGKAGSGKSTLMKFISENPQTTQCLSKWAGECALYRASFFFWNQGTEMQKSGLGLFQSILYQILRATPTLIQSVCSRRLHHEPWTMEELYDTFQRIEQEIPRLRAKFCFFIDGLDEFEGEEEDIVRLLNQLSISRCTKICASSRPGRQYEKSLRKHHWTLDIAHFTRADMNNHINKHLNGSANWQRLMESHPTDCKKIVGEISARASGVWLWVSLVTKDIVREADRNEDVETLYEIVIRFPKDLRAYFTMIIDKIPELHRKDMARIFLVTMEQLHPQPLYAFALLEKEKRDSLYALHAPIKPVPKEEMKLEFPALIDRIRSRCSDLLEVDDSHALYTWKTGWTHGNIVDFLHRSVREFLDDYNHQLRGYLEKDDFNPLLSLSRIYLGLLKALPADDRHQYDNVGVFSGLMDNVLFYAREFELRCKSEDYAPMVSILDELGKVTSYHLRRLRNDHPHGELILQNIYLHAYHESNENGKYAFFALTVGAGLVKYVRPKLEADSTWIRKPGPPLLDYALRTRKRASLWESHSTWIRKPEPPLLLDYALQTRSAHFWEVPSVSVEMVELLLSPKNNPDPNQPVYLSGCLSVWAMFLLSISEDHQSESTENSLTYRSLNEAWYDVCEKLIRAGARSDCLSNVDYPSIGRRTPPPDAYTILKRVFGDERAAVLIGMMEEQETADQNTGTTGCSIM